MLWATTDCQVFHKSNIVWNSLVLVPKIMTEKCSFRTSLLLLLACSILLYGVTPAFAATVTFYTYPTNVGSFGVDPSRMRTLENRYLLRGVGYAA